jgi:hypothetical protein
MNKLKTVPGVIEARVKAPRWLLVIMILLDTVCNNMDYCNNHVYQKKEGEYQLILRKT